MRMMKAHHAEAARKGVKIVHCCGFDSIPSDLGTLYMVDYMQEKLNRYLNLDTMPSWHPGAIIHMLVYKDAQHVPSLGMPCMKNR